MWIKKTLDVNKNKQSELGKQSAVNKYVGKLDDACDVICSVARVRTFDPTKTKVYLSSV